MHEDAFKPVKDSSVTLSDNGKIAQNKTDH